MTKRKRLVSQIDFSLGKGKSLVISLSSSIGLDRIIVENENGIVRVRAEGHSRFEFSEGKTEPGTCDFWLGNPSTATGLKEYLEGKFWSQFNWGELFRHQKDAKLKKALKVKIQELVDEFEGRAAQQLNDVLKKQKKNRKSATRGR